MIGKLRARVLATARGGASRSLELTTSLNRRLGQMGASRYRALLIDSEQCDPVADVAPMVEIRSRAEAEGVSVGFPDRIESNDRIYGIKSAIFGTDRLGPGSPAVEHGLFLGEFVIAEDTIQTAAPAAITFGDYRKKQIQRRQQLPVFTVGPYIQYAQSHWPADRIAQEKKAAGRTLVVFLSHTTPDSGHADSHAADLRWIESAAQGFDSVIVCVYWWNLNDIEVRELAGRGYRIVSCGLMHDRNFLSRLKTILRLADHVVTNGVGTHIGYALAEGIDVSLSNQREVAVAPTAHTRAEKRTGVRAVDPSVMRTIAEAFVSAGGTVRAGNAEALDGLWGFSHVRSTEEIEAMSAIADDIVRVSRGRVKRYPRVVRSLLDEYRIEDGLRFRLLSASLGR